MEGINDLIDAGDSVKYRKIDAKHIAVTFCGRLGDAMKVSADMGNSATIKMRYANSRLSYLHPIQGLFVCFIRYEGPGMFLGYVRWQRVGDNQSGGWG